MASIELAAICWMSLCFSNVAAIRLSTYILKGVFGWCFQCFIGGFFESNFALVVGVGGSGSSGMDRSLMKSLLRGVW